ncbi:MAG: TetR/AcrR family transcriptional regulator [Bacteroidia bacterium]
MAEIMAPRKTQIYTIAENLFREKGYSATSMRHLANEIGIEAASIYSHIKNKQEILRSICFRMADEFFAEIHQIGGQYLAPETQLRESIKAHIRVITKNVNAASVFFHDWKFLEEPDLSHFKAMREQYEDHFKQIINKGISTEVFSATNLSFTTRTFLAALNWTYEWYTPEGNLSPAEIGENLADLLMKGILKPKN